MIVKADKNELYLYGYIYNGDGVYFLNEFSKVDGVYPVIEVNLHTYGGSVFDGNMIFNAMITAKSQVNTNVIGVGASMGGILSQAGEIRRQVNNGFLMIHAATGGTYGTAKDHLSSANLLSEMEKQFVKLLVAKTGKPAKDVKNWLVGDNWFSAEQAKKEGLIDEIIDPLATLDIDIDDPGAIGPEELYNRFAASLGVDKLLPQATLDIPVNEYEIIKPKDTEMKQDVIQVLQLPNVTAQSSDTAVIAAIQAHIDAKVNDFKTKYENEKTARENLETAVNTQKDTQVKTLLDMAVAGKKITETQRTVYENIGKTSGVDALKTVLDGLSPRNSITGQIAGKTTASAAVKEGWDWDKYQKENPKALEALKKEDTETFNALFKTKFGVDYKE